MSKPLIRVYQPAELVQLLASDPRRTGWYRRAKKRREGEAGSDESDGRPGEPPPSPPAV